MDHDRWLDRQQWPQGQEDFRNVVIVMTTNAGAAELSKTSMGFTTAKQSGDEMGEIRGILTPRTTTGSTHHLLPGAQGAIILRVVDKFLMQLEEQLHEKKVDISFTPALHSTLPTKGFDPQMGAQPMAQAHPGHHPSRALADSTLSPGSGEWRQGDRGACR